MNKLKYYCLRYQPYLLGVAFFLAIFLVWAIGRAFGFASLHSLLADDFMHPRLYCFPSRHANCAYRLLSGCADKGEHLKLLSPLTGAPQLHDYDRPLEHVIDQFVDALDATPV